MSDNKLVKTNMDATTLTGLGAGIGWISKTVVKEIFTADPSVNVMNYAKCSRHGGQRSAETVSRR